MKRMVVMAGISGAGKSTVAKRLFDGWKVIDCDELKKQCKGYDVKNPSLVHEESKRLESLNLRKLFAVKKISCMTPLQRTLNELLVLSKKLNRLDGRWKSCM